MSRHDVLRSPAGAAPLVDLAPEHGMRHADSLPGTPLTRDALDDLDAEVRLRDELQIITNILSALHQVPGLASRLACVAVPHHPGSGGLRS